MADGPQQTQFRRGTTAQIAAFTGVVAEVTFDTDLNLLQLHDGSTAGGLEVTMNLATQTLTGKTLVTPTIVSFTNATHDHADAAGGGLLTTLGTVATGVWEATVVTVTFGGSGRASATAFGVICGGTTTTGAHQSIASVGTSGQVLTSNGVGALPTMQTISAQAQGDVLDDLNTLGAAASDGQFIVATAAGVFAYESGGTARASLGLGTFAVENLNAVPAQTLAGKMSAADQEIERPKFKDYGETVNAVGVFATGSNATIDLTLGNVVTGTISANVTLIFANPPATGINGSFTLTLTNGAAATLTWPTSVDWAGGTAPTLTASGVDVLTFTTNDAGTIWYGFAAGLDMQ